MSQYLDTKETRERMSERLRRQTPDMSRATAEHIADNSIRRVERKIETDTLHRPPKSER